MMAVWPKTASVYICEYACERQSKCGGKRETEKKREKERDRDREDGMDY